VENFLKDNGWESVSILPWMSGHWLEAQDYPQAMIEIKKLKNKALQLGASEVLLFYAGPVDLASYVGALCQNWVPVKVFALSKGTFHHNITLEKSSAGLGNLADHLTEAIKDI
jgi:hypothetical protein